MTKRKYCLLVSCMLIIVVLVASNWHYSRMSYAYYQETQNAVQSLEDHVDSMIYNLNVFLDNTADPKAAISFAYLHSVLCEEDFAVVKRYCTHYNSNSFLALVHDDKYTLSQRGSVLSLDEKLAEFQVFLQNICVNEMHYIAEAQLRDELSAAKHALECIRDSLKKYDWDDISTPEEMIKTVLVAVDDVNLSLSE